MIMYPKRFSFKDIYDVKIEGKISFFFTYYKNNSSYYFKYTQNFSSHQNNEKNF